MADTSEEELLDKVYLYITEKCYADGTSENCKRIDAIKIEIIAIKCHPKIAMTDRMYHASTCICTGQVLV